METLFKPLIKARALTAAILLLVLAAGQWALLEHSFDLAEHDQGEVCELCIQLSGSKFVSVSDFPSYLINSLTVWMPVLSVTSISSSVNRYQAARGPPAHLLS